MGREYRKKIIISHKINQVWFQLWMKGEVWLLDAKTDEIETDGDFRHQHCR